LNMVFAGNPGTGKTSIARLVAQMLNSMGFLKIGQLVETDRSSFVSNIPGETAKKTEKKFKEALGGVLFIDEAYTLANDSLGREAIETLLKLVEDYSREVIVILAGYEKEMEEFFDVNIGLRSRFPLWTNFEDYNPNELLEMAIRLVEAKGFKLSKNGHLALKKSFVDIYENSDAQSG
ncbi:AAA family ATPase, partial [Clostridium perfringens]